MFIQPIKCGACNRDEADGVTISGQLGVFKAHCPCTNVFDVSRDQLVLSRNLYFRLLALSNHVQIGQIPTPPGITQRVVFETPFEFIGHVSLTPLTPKGFPNGIYPHEIMVNNAELLFGTPVVLEEALQFGQEVTIAWMVWGLVGIDALPSWLVLFYGAMIQLNKGLPKAALLDYAIAFELFVGAFLRDRLSRICKLEIADYLLEKVWKIEERVKELMEEACGYRLTARPDIYQPWYECVQKPRNELAHGKQLTVDQQEAERAHQATWQAIKWIESLP